MYKQGRYPVVRCETLAKGIFDVEILCPEIAQLAQAGQFAQVAVEGFFLRRPISICQINKDKGTIRLVFEVRGKGTKQLSFMGENSMIDIMAPLGKGFKVLEKGKKAVCIGGGIGVPPMVGIAERYGENATVISGFRNMAAVILQRNLEAAGVKTVLCTDDGSAGKKGFVTDALTELLKSGKPDIIYACGPMVMLKNVAKIAEENGVECQVSLEQRMACGVGACLVCACRTVKDGKEIHSHVCKDGPVFDSKEVVFE